MLHKSVLRSLGVFLFLTLVSAAPAQVSFFQPPTYAGTGANTFVADFNGDGKPDILTADGTMNLGNGDGTFKLGAAVSGGALAVADFNGDGKPDVLQQGTGTLLVLLGKGDGTFQAAISSAPTNYTLTNIVAVDLNGDGKADVVGIFNTVALVYLSNGDGTFAAPVSYNIGATQTTKTALSIGDFNGDHLMDLAVTNGAAGQEIVFPGKGDGTFLAPVTSTGTAATYSVTGDFNGDGKLDLALNTGYVLLGSGDGKFQAPISAFPSCDFLAVADVNGDHKVDLVLQQDVSYPPIREALIYLGKGDGSFSPSFNYALGFQFSNVFTFGVAIADLNGDGKLDVASGNAVLLGGGDGTFQGIPVGTGGVGYPIAAKFDKNSALGVAGITGGSVSILQNNGNGVLQSAHSYPIQGGNATLIVSADFNGDSNLDLFVTAWDFNTRSWSYSVLLGNGDGTFQSPVYYFGGVYTGEDQNSIIAADFRHNQKMDVVVGPGGPELALFSGNGDGTFSGPVFIPGVQRTEFELTSLMTADFNGDGNLDIAVGLAGTAPPQVPSTQVLFGNGDGTFQPIVTPPTLANIYTQFTADFNSDGKPDLIGSISQPCSTCTNSFQVAAGGVNGTFSLLPAMPLTSVLAVADFNGDGYPDLFVLSSPQQSGILLGNGDGTFRPLINVPTSGFFPSVLIADMNGDGRPDILFPSVGGFGVMLNATAPGFEVFTGALSPATVTAGNQTTGTVKLTPMFGFNSSVTLSCAGLPGGATCAFNPPTIANSSGTSTLTITTTTATTAGTYPVQVKGSAGSTVNSAALSLVVQAAPSFEFASSGPSSKTVSAGQSASFTLSVTPLAAFNGTVKLTCAITPVVTPAPTCSLSNSTVQISGSSAQSITVTVGTTAPMTAGIMLFPGSPSGTGMLWILGYSVAMLASLLLMVSRRKVLGAVLVPAFVALTLSLGCGGSSSSHQQPGTPVGNYNAKITGTSGAVNNTISFQVTVQ
jgi:hypothetical protein